MVKRFSDQSKQLILNVFNYFHNLSAEKDAIVLEQNVVSQAAEALGISERSIYRLRKPTKSDSEFTAAMSDNIRQMKTRVDSVILNSLREIIYKMYAAEQHVTLKSLHDRFTEECPDCPCSIRSISTWIKKIGFRFKNSSNRLFLTEQPCIQFKRLSFLRKYLLHKETKLYTPVFIDETWVYSKGGCRKSWQDGQSGSTSKKKGDGCRYIVLHAGNENGFIENASLIFKSNTKSGDYHDNMNQDNFEKWFKSQLIPNLEGPSVIIMDNASYHCRLKEAIPNRNWTKEKLRNWLQEKCINFPSNGMKDELWKIISVNLPEKNYHLDQYAEENGHIVLRLPPYHCQYNAIEMVWSQCKRFYDKIINKTKSSPEDVVNAWNISLQQVTAAQWKNYVIHTEKVIEEAWEVEKRVDSSDTLPLIISNTSEDSETSDDDFSD